MRHICQSIICKGLIGTIVMFLLNRLFFSLMLVLPIILNTALAASWTTQEKLQRFWAQTHHWGQKDDQTPNHGWATYSALKIDQGGIDLIVLRQHGGELLGG